MLRLRSCASSMISVSYFAQPPVAANLVQQDAVRHHLDERRRARLIREAHLETDGLADAHVELGGEPARDGLRGDAPRLRVADHPVDAAARLEAELRQLRRLAAARVAADDDDAMLSRSPPAAPRVRP